jgi:GTPase Era involved in 16S rRNA processing
VLEQLESAGVGGHQRILVLNKIDAVHGGITSSIATSVALDLAVRFPAERVLALSAKTGKGVDELKAHLVSMATPQPWPFDPTNTNDMGVRYHCAYTGRYTGLASHVC